MYVPMPIRAAIVVKPIKGITLLVSKINLSNIRIPPQVAKEAIYSGLDEAKSTIEIKGNVYGKMENSILTEVYFTIGTTTGGDMIDFTDTSSNGSNLVVISYTDQYQIFPTVNWTMSKLNTTAPDNLLDKNELFLITVDLSCVSANATPAQVPGPYHEFSLEVKPPVGAVLVLERTIPARVDQIVNLY